MDKIGKLKLHSESCSREHKLFSVTHDLARKVVSDLMRFLLDEIKLVTDEITGNEYLSIVGTFLSDISCYVIEEMHRVSQSDDTKFTKEEIINSIFESIEERLTNNKHKISYYLKGNNKNDNHEFKTINQKNYTT